MRLFSWLGEAARTRTGGRVGAFGLVAAVAVSTPADAAWPPAADADVRDRTNWPNDYDDPWTFRSSLPERAPGAPPLDPFDQSLGSAGMSIDRAWTHTIGDPAVTIAVVDTGIEWDDPDLVNQAALNLGELADERKRPRDRDGKPCGGTGPLAGYDCNADGVFSVADYRDDPRIAPVVRGEPCFREHDREKPAGDRIQGDLNRNCVLDPNDLLLLFADGVDDDANGYADDICGWDFFKNDPDAYDDSRSGHGSAVARASVAEANNGVGAPGVCPGCRFVPLRVGDSVVSDANDFAKAAIYAADNRAAVIQAGLRTVNQSEFSRAALEYAHRHDALVIAGIGDDGTRAHEMLATANQVLVVGPVRYAGTSPAAATSFVAGTSCGNFGGQLGVSISALGCSSEATAYAAGIAGLAFSAGRRRGLTLRAGEVLQLFLTSADDIDVPASRPSDPTTPPPYLRSQPGFDQRFGHGRANAERMVTAIESGLVPPEVEIVAPAWFTPVYGDQGPVPILGRVSATRARAYDLSIQWAPGVEPAEASFRNIVAPLVNVPGQTPSGSTVPLAQLDPSQVDSSPVPVDRDSPLGENARAVTIRIRAVAHYDGGDRAGEARRVIAITNDKRASADPRERDLLPGFPIALGGSLEASPKLADIDGDGVRDVVVPDGSGRLHVLSLHTGAPREVQGFPYVARTIDGLAGVVSPTESRIPSYLGAPAYGSGARDGVDPTIARESLVAAPAIADIDGDGRIDIVFTSWAGTIYAVDAEGRDLAGWPRRLPLVPSCPTTPPEPGGTPAERERCMDPRHLWARGTASAPVLVDLDRDGHPEIVVAGFDGRLWAFDRTGAVASGYPVDLASAGGTSGGRLTGTPTAVDLNRDGTPDLVVGSNEPFSTPDGTPASAVFAVDGRGTRAPGGPLLANWPVLAASRRVLPVLGEGLAGAFPAADIDRDGVPDLVVQGVGQLPLLLRADPGSPAAAGAPPSQRPIWPDAGGRGLEPPSGFGPRSGARPDVFVGLLGQPAVGDIDQDGFPDVVASGGSARLIGALRGDETAPLPLQHLVGIWSGRSGQMLPGAPLVVGGGTSLVNPALADVSGDDYPEVIVGTDDTLLHAADGCGREAEGFPKTTHGSIRASAAVGDIDGDTHRSLEIVVGTRDGWLFAWTTRGRASGSIPWESFHHDNANTGSLDTPLAQGGPGRPPRPLDCNAPAPTPAERYEAGGGCAGCVTGGRNVGAAASPAALALAIALAIAGRRITTSIGRSTSRARPRRRCTCRR